MLLHLAGIRPPRASLWHSAARACRSRALAPHFACDSGQSQHKAPASSSAAAQLSPLLLPNGKKLRTRLSSVVVGERLVVRLVRPRDTESVFDYLFETGPLPPFCCSLSCMDSFLDGLQISS